MRDSALAYPTVASLLENGVAELSLFWRMENGLLLKVRLDWLGEFAGAPFLLDIKTTDDVLDFGKSVEKFAYHLQAAFYEFVMEKVFGLGVDFAFCAISKRHECGRYPVLLGILDEEDGYTGRQLIEEILFHLATGYSHSTSCLATVSRPWWAKQADRKRREAQGGDGMNVTSFDAINSIHSDLQATLLQHGLVALLPTHVTPEQFTRTAANALIENRDLQFVDKSSLVMALKKYATDGLMGTSKNLTRV